MQIVTQNDYRPRCRMWSFKTPKRKHWEKVHATGFRKDSLGVTLRAQTTKAKIYKWDYIKTK